MYLKKKKIKTKQAKNIFFFLQFGGILWSLTAAQLKRVVDGKWTNCSVQAWIVIKYMQNPNQQQSKISGASDGDQPMIIGMGPQHKSTPPSTFNYRAHNLKSVCNFRRISGHDFICPHLCQNKFNSRCRLMSTKMKSITSSTVPAEGQ